MNKEFRELAGIQERPQFAGFDEAAVLAESRPVSQDRIVEVKQDPKPTKAGWYILAGGKYLGPFSRSQVKALIWKTPGGKPMQIK